MTPGPVDKSAKFTCKSCGGTVFHAKNDFQTWIDQDYLCPLCWTVIIDKRYKVNIKGGVTIFCAAGSKEFGNALGDRVVMEVVKRKYLEDNPDEKVYFLDVEDDHLLKIQELKPDKIFKNEFYREDDHMIPGIRVNIQNEADRLAQLGYYPKLEFQPVKPECYDLIDEYACLHIRNISKTPKEPMLDRNLDPKLAEDIVNFLLANDQKIVILGKDRVDDKFGDLENVTDLRNKLSLPEIAYVLKYAKLFIGRDSGLMHVAAAVGCSVVAFNFSNSKWFPKMPAKDFTALMKQDSSVTNILKAIRERL